MPLFIIDDIFYLIYHLVGQGAIHGHQVKVAGVRAGEREFGLHDIAIRADYLRGVVDVRDVGKYVRGLPYVAHVEENLYTCSQDTQDHIRDMIIEKNLNHAVVASCSPRTHEPLFQQTTLQAFQDAGAGVSSFQEVLDLGVYLTTAVKCGKTGYGIKAGTIKACSHLLESELNLFPSVKAYLLMGDVAIKAVNYIAKRAGEGRVIPAGSTYKIRGGEFSFRGARAFPSYLQAGPSFFIEKSKRKMIAEDIASALRLVK